MSQSTQKFDIDNQQLSLAGSDLSISKGNTITLPLAIPTGGTSGQLLAKQSDTNYDVTWVNEAPASSYTSVIKHKVKAGESLTKGQAVYVSRASDTNMVVTKASNTSEATSSKTMGLIAQTLANNGQGDVVVEGLLSGLNTNTATIGDPVWLGTNGNLIYGLTNKPYAPTHLVFIGIVTRVSATVGEIFVKIQNGFALNEIHDVDLKTTAPVNGDILAYNGTLWVNKTITGVGGQAQLNGTGFVKATGTTITFDNSTYLTTSSAASTYLPINNPTATGTLTSPTISNTLGATFATTSGNVGIGNTNPFYKLDIQGSGVTTQRIVSTDNQANFSLQGTFGQFSNEVGDFYLNNNSASGNIIFRAGSTTERMRIFANGRVGINTTTDAGYLLDVNGTARVTGNVSIGTTINTRTLAVHTNTNSVNFESANTNTTGTNYSISSFAFGVGATLNVGGLFQASGATSNYGLRVFNVAATANNYSLYSDSPAQSYFEGNVGIGTTAPQNLLHVKGTASVGVGVRNSHLTIESAETAGVDVGAILKFAGQSGNTVNPYSFGTIEAKKESAVANNYSSYLSFHSIDNTGGSTERMRINGSGNVGIGTTIPTSKLQVVGLPVYETNAAAVAGGLTAGAFYRTSTGILMVTF
jgi:hypothetical protein